MNTVPGRGQPASARQRPPWSSRPSAVLRPLPPPDQPVQRAHRLLVEGDPTAALAAYDDYRKDYKRNRLHPERYNGWNY